MFGSRGRREYSTLDKQANNDQPQDDWTTWGSNHKTTEESVFSHPTDGMLSATIEGDVG